MQFKLHLVSKKSEEHKVELITGSREAYEHLYLKYLKPNILSAVIVGSKYSPPCANDIYSCLKNLSQSGRGIVVIIPNIIEEVANFKDAIDKASSTNIPVRLLAIGEDSPSLPHYRRCLAGLAFVFKLAGSMKESSMSMEDIYQCLKMLKIMSLSCHLRKTFSFVGTDMEPWTGKFIDTCKLSTIMSKMLDHIFPYWETRSLCTKSRIILINIYTNEKSIIDACNMEILKLLNLRKCNFVRVYSGNFVFGPRGFSISVIENACERIIKIADAVCTNLLNREIEVMNLQKISPMTLGPFIMNSDFIDIPIIYACEAMISSEEVFNKLDVNHAFGSAIVPILKSLLHKTINHEISHVRPLSSFKIISLLFQNSVEDIHGKLFNIFFIGMAEALSHYSADVPLIPKIWVEALAYGVNYVKNKTNIMEGDFTFIDTLSPFANSLEFHMCSDRNMVERLGDTLYETNTFLESTYEIESPQKKKGHPEVSAQAVLVALTSVVQGIRVVMNTMDKNG